MKDWNEDKWSQKFRKCTSHPCWERVTRDRREALQRYEKKRKAHFEKFPWMYTTNMGGKPTHPPHRVLWDAKYENYSAWSGKPHCRFLSEKLGFRVNFWTRNAIWNDYWNGFERRDNPKRKVSKTWSEIANKAGFDYNKWRASYS